jgi:hypothetical protein
MFLLCMELVFLVLNWHGAWSTKVPSLIASWLLISSVPT